MATVLETRDTQYRANARWRQSSVADEESALMEPDTGWRFGKLMKSRSNG
jgi:hypothetical protein